MRKEYYNYSVKMPLVLHEMFRQIEIKEDDLPEDIPSDWEETMYQEYSRKDFARGIYV